MSRYGPQVLPDSTRGMGLLAAQLQGLIEDKARRKDDKDRDEERKRQQGREARSDELQDLSLAKSGIHRGTAPGAIPDDEYERTLPGLGMAEGAAPGAGGLGDRLNQYVSGGDSGEIEVAALPGQHIGGGQFTKKAIYRVVPRIGLQDPAARGDSNMRPRHRQLTPNYYEETAETPEYEAEQEAEAGQARKQLDLSRYIEDLRGAGLSEPQARIGARNPSLLDNFMFPKKDYEGARLDESRRHNREMEGIQRDREGRLGRDEGESEGKKTERADKRHAQYKTRATDYAKGLVQRNYGREAAEAGAEAGPINYNALVHEVSRYFKNLKPGEADGIVSEAIKAHGGGATVSDRPVRFQTDSKDGGEALRSFIADAKKRGLSKEKAMAEAKEKGLIK